VRGVHAPAGFLVDEPRQGVPLTSRAPAVVLLSVGLDAPADSATAASATGSGEALAHSLAGVGPVHVVVVHRLRDAGVHVRLAVVDLATPHGGEDQLGGAGEVAGDEVEHVLARRHVNSESARVIGPVASRSDSAGTGTRVHGQTLEL